MEGKNQHVVKRPDGWAVRCENNQKDTSHHRTQKDAISEARGIARNQKSAIVIYRRDGKIREKNSHGNDPYPPKG